MKKLVLFFFPLLIAAAGNKACSQDTLPDFSLKNAGKNRIVVSWVNPFHEIRQLSIQRSADSLKGYKTILTMADPTTPQNGYVDNKAPNGQQFYRLYIMLEGGRYLFSAAKRPGMDTLIVKKPGTIRVVDSLLRVDSITRVSPVVIRLDNFQTGDSATLPNAVTVKNQPTAFVPSLYVYTNKDGYVKVSLPGESKGHKYSIRFFEEDGTLIFELKDIKENNFKIDKASFYHAGWFRFEIYEDGKLLEKHKFYLEKDF
ncbi:MAG: hypothetical protein HYZ15_08095 [Sphingobacteriales bacterium]|nr:hypothetical protein [Sphingobacteriales bacterium]